MSIDRNSKRADLQVILRNYGGDRVDGSESIELDLRKTFSHNFSEGLVCLVVFRYARSANVSNRYRRERVDS